MAAPVQQLCWVPLEWRCAHIGCFGHVSPLSSPYTEGSGLMGNDGGNVSTLSKLAVDQVGTKAILLNPSF